MPKKHRLVRAMEEALEHARTGKTAGRVSVVIPNDIDVEGVRVKTGMSQSAFAAAFGVSVGTLRNWEQKHRRPDGPARVLLTLIERNPKAVFETLHAPESTKPIVSRKKTKASGRLRGVHVSSSPQPVA